MGQQVLEHSRGRVEFGHCVLDGHFGHNGHNGVLQVVRQHLGLHLISKLRRDSELYFSYEGAQNSGGRRRIYGERLEVKARPLACWVSVVEEKGFCSEVYQAHLRHKHVPCTLNVVILVKTHRLSGKRFHALLFSSDLELEATQNSNSKRSRTRSDLELEATERVKFSQLRYQIEFNFRDAKQFWGLEDWMKVEATSVTNAANLSLFMVSVSHCLLEKMRTRHAKAGVLDLKAFWRGRYYAQATLKWLVHKPTPTLMKQIIQHVATQGAIHAQNKAYPTP